MSPPVGTAGRTLDERPGVHVPAVPALALPDPWSVAAVVPGSPEIEVVARWMDRPHVARYWQQAWPVDVWSAQVAVLLAGDHARPWLVALDGDPVAYVEVYRVARDVIAAHHPVEPHDLGVHVAIGDVDRTGHGLGRLLLAAVADALLAADPACDRVLADPDAAHDVARRAFAGAGFAPVAEVDLPHKRAALMARPRRPVPSTRGSAR